MKSLILALVLESATLLLLTGTTLGQHIHATVDTTAGAPGDSTLIRVGYLGGEHDYSIDGEGRLRRAGEIAVFRVIDLLPQSGEFHLWAAGQGVVLTSDFYFATGRLAGGNFKFELVSIDAVFGQPSIAAWGGVGTGQFVAEARTTGAARLARSFNVGIGQHNHNQAWAFSRGGVYDLTLIAWDSNGRYTDSAPMTLRVSTDPLPNCPGDANADHLVNFSDITAVLTAWGNTYVVEGAGTGDASHDQVVDFADITAVLSNWGAACP